MSKVQYYDLLEGTMNNPLSAIISTENYTIKWKYGNVKSCCTHFGVEMDGDLIDLVTKTIESYKCVVNENNCQFILQLTDDKIFKIIFFNNKYLTCVQILQISINDEIKWDIRL